MDSVLSHGREALVLAREQPIVALAALVLLPVALRLVGAALDCVRPARKLTRFGKWAVVTGATDGIGKAYCYQFAKRGLNVVLISRTLERLETTAADLAAKYPSCEFKVVVADFSKSEDDADYHRIEGEIEDLDVGVLVNNVGCSYPGALYFHELDDRAPDLPQRMINLNVASTTHMTRIVVSGMVARRRGVIVNISSAACRIPIGNPLYAEYSASKAYVDFLSRSMAAELHSKGVIVQCHAPYLVTSKLSKVRHPSLFTPTPATWTNSSVNWIGLGGSSIVPHWSHRVQDFVIQTLPHWALRSTLMSMHLGLRKRYLEKLDGKKTN